MRALIQRVQRASVNIGGQEYSAIGAGYLVLLGITDSDQHEDIEWLCRKIINLRLFNDENGVMNESLLQVKGEVLVVSQFTLHANVKKGSRPSYIKAAKPDIAIPLYERFLQDLNQLLDHTEVKSGQFGANMQVQLINDGPVSIWIDSKERGY